MSRDLHCKLLVDLEEQREAVKRQNVADLLEQRRCERQAVAKRASTSDDVKTPPTDPASQFALHRGMYPACPTLITAEFKAESDTEAHP